MLDRFNATFQGRERSRVVEKLMLDALEAEEDEIAAAAGKSTAIPNSHPTGKSLSTAPVRSFVTTKWDARFPNFSGA